MITIFRKGFRVINNVAVPDCAGGCNPNVLALSVNRVYGSAYSRERIIATVNGHCNPHPKDCNLALGPHQMQALNEYVISNTAAVKHKALQDVNKRRNFHTSTCLNSYEDLQKGEKREANILIWMCVTMLVTVGIAYSFIDREEYDRPTVEKS